jgi:branched-chain amino acid transport system permease protein
LPQIANIAVSILFDGLAYAMFLFITAVGLSVTMGLMGFVNLAHGAFAMAGGYFVVSLTRSYGIDFVPSLVIAAVLVALISVRFERRLYRRLYKAGELDQVLLTIGLAFMAIATFTYFYGPIPKSVPLPEWLQGDVNLGFRNFPTYRAFLIVLGAGLVAVLWFAFEKTNIGAKIRAAVDNRRMAESVGINVDLLFTVTFALGSGLAALGGGLAIGGLGSLKGTLMAALVLGIVDTGGKYLMAEAGGFFIYVITVIVLLIKPAGFYGRE